jgi:hypothetical protein
MLVGCVIGLPALLWVLILFLIILYVHRPSRPRSRDPSHAITTNQAGRPAE